MKTKPTLTLLGEVEAALQLYAGEECFCNKDLEFTCASCCIENVKPSMRELVRRAGEVDETALDATLEIAQAAGTVTTLSYEEVIRIYCKEAIRPHLAPVASGWQTIESAPKDGIRYLGMIVGDRFYGEPFVCYYDEDEGHICLHQTEARLHRPTHWQHFPAPTLPQPPKKD